jgi:hypothetical protein
MPVATSCVYGIAPGTLYQNYEVCGQKEIAIHGLNKHSNHSKSQLHDPDWGPSARSSRADVQRLEVGPAKVTIVVRLPVEQSACYGLEPIMVTLS